MDASIRAAAAGASRESARSSSLGGVPGERASLVSSAGAFTPAAGLISPSAHRGRVLP